VALPRGFHLEGAAGREEAVRVVCPRIEVARPMRRRSTEKGARPDALLRNLRMEGAITVGGGARVVLEGCTVIAPDTGIHVSGDWSSAKLVGVSITAGSVGVSGQAGCSLDLQECRIVSCGTDGIRLDSPMRVSVRDSYIAKNSCNGVMLESCRKADKDPAVVFSGNSIFRNSQFGVWTNLGAHATWQGNWMEANKLGEKGGTGSLQGWQKGTWLQTGDECLAWLEERGQWLKGSVVAFPSHDEDPVKLSIKRPAQIEKGKPTGSAEPSPTMEVEVPRKALRPLHFTEAHLPPVWSKCGPVKALGSYQHFLKALGLSKGDALLQSRFRAPTKERQDAIDAAQRDKRRYDREVAAWGRERSEAEGQPSAPRPKKRALPTALLPSKRRMQHPKLHPSQEAEEAAEAPTLPQDRGGIGGQQAAKETAEAPTMPPPPGRASDYPGDEGAPPVPPPATKRRRGRGVAQPN